MMQTTQPRHRDDLAVGVGSHNRGSACRRLLRQSEVSPILVVVADIFGHQTLPFYILDLKADWDFGEGPVVQKIGRPKVLY